jgi:predicted flap endonuclease-1-like 5' DNA nuclease
MSYKIQEVEGIGPSYAAKLADAGIETTDDFLKLCCDAKGRSAISLKTGISEGMILNWANMADLMRVSGVGKQFAELLHAAGVDTIKELRTRNADNLAAKMNEANAVKKLTKGSASVPQVQKWIDSAKGLDALITH